MQHGVGGQECSRGYGEKAVMKVRSGGGEIEAGAERERRQEQRRKQGQSDM